MRICTKDGKLIEAQSHAVEGTLLANAKAAGITGAVENEVSDEEFSALLKASRPAKTYAELRAAEYPPVADYLDAVVKNDAAQIQAYISACLAVKAKYPK